MGRASASQRTATPLSGAPSHAARRYLYKVKGPEACNFPVTPELAAELDALTVEQIQEQFKQRCTGTQRAAWVWR